MTQKTLNFKRAILDETRNLRGWQAENENYVISVQIYEKRYWVFFAHKKFDAYYNTLWEDVDFASLAEAETYCLSFNPAKKKWVGKDKEFWTTKIAKRIKPRKTN